MDPAPDNNNRDSDSPPDPPSGGARHRGGGGCRNIDCSNYGRSEDVQGHERSGLFRCIQCTPIEERRRALAKQVALRRVQQEEIEDHFALLTPAFTATAEYLPLVPRPLLWMDPAPDNNNRGSASPPDPPSGGDRHWGRGGCRNITCANYYGGSEDVHRRRRCVQYTPIKERTCTGALAKETQRALAKERQRALAKKVALRRAQEEDIEALIVLPPPAFTATADSNFRLAENNYCNIFPRLPVLSESVKIT